jgi:hypothetical protein
VKSRARYHDCHQRLSSNWLLSHAAILLRAGVPAAAAIILYVLMQDFAARAAEPIDGVFIKSGLVLPSIGEEGNSR